MRNGKIFYKEAFELIFYNCSDDGDLSPYSFDITKGFKSASFCSFFLHLYTSSFSTKNVDCQSSKLDHDEIA